MKNLLCNNKEIAVCTATTTTPQSIPHSDLKKAATASTSADQPTRAKIEGRPHSPGQRDASDTFGEHVAAKHRQYVNYVKSYVEHAVSQVLFEADMGKYDPPPPGHWQNQAMQQHRPPPANQPHYADTGTTLANNSRAKNAGAAATQRATKTTAVSQANASASNAASATPTYPKTIQPHRATH